MGSRGLGMIGSIKMDLQMLGEDRNVGLSHEIVVTARYFMDLTAPCCQRSPRVSVKL